MRQHTHPRLLCLCLPVCCAGDLDGVAYLQKYTTLEHMQADQVAKLQSDIIYRRLLEVSAAARVECTWNCWLGLSVVYRLADSRIHT